MLRSFFLFALIQYINAACDNQCSGRGTCTIDDICKCYDNFGVGLAHHSGDCSDRVCPYDISWIDKPDNEGTFHKYAECSGKGICSRDTGECACLEGFEGKACQRSACPNSCSGHGTCEYIEDLTFATTYTDYSAFSATENSYINTAPKVFPYANWDTRKTRACVCDANYGDVDCSKKLCPYGADVLDSPDEQHLSTSVKYFKQVIYISSAVALSTLASPAQTFALTFISRTNETFTTVPIVFKNPASKAAEFANDIKLALQNLPNKVVDGISVTVLQVAATILEIRFVFSGNSVQGPQNYLIVETDACDKAGCTPKITGLNIETRRTPGLAHSNATILYETTFYNSYECGRRGKCDYTSGLCKCFLGYTGDNCNTLTTLA